MSCLSDQTVLTTGPYMPICPVCRVGMIEGEDAEEYRAWARIELAGKMIRDREYQGV